MPRRDGLLLLEDLKTAGVAAPVVMMSGQAHIEMAVRATRLGALDFLEKPLSTEKLLSRWRTRSSSPASKVRTAICACASASTRWSSPAKPCAA
jgi:FixJ family two-component response regulator